MLTLAVRLEADADSMRIDCYSKAMAKVFSTVVRGPFYAGWNSLAAPVTGLSNGLYFVVLTGKLDSGESESLAVPAKLYWLN